MAENLYCPRCAKPFTPDTSFCRTCGLSLAGVCEIVGGEAASAPVMITRPNFKAMRYGLGLFIFGLAIGMLNGAIKDLDLFPQVYGKMVFLTLVAMGMLTMGAGFVFPTKRYAKPKTAGSKASGDTRDRLDTAPLAPQLAEVRAFANDIDFAKDDREPEMVPAASVTEHTTRDLR